MSVTQVTPLGAKQPLPADLFNITNFEWSMSDGSEKFQNRGAYPPFSDWPDASRRVEYLDLASYYGDYIPALTGFAIAAYQRPAKDYMDADLLRKSYQAAYRLLFARRLADVLSPDLDHSDNRNVTRTYQIQAVTLVPAFVYTVEALIGITALFACVLLIFSYTTGSNLQSDPASIASQMALIADDSTFRRYIGRYDQASADDVKEAFADSRFSLNKHTGSEQDQPYGLKSLTHPSGERSVPRKIVPADRLLPKEYRWFSGLSFLLTQIGVVVTLSWVFTRANAINGLPLPSSSVLVNQLVKNYIPMAVAACFEPIWVMLNRLSCMLQPYEQLRNGRSHPRSSLNIDYSSLPSQAVVGRAVRAGHLSLAIICTMALLANVLSITFNSIFVEDVVETKKATTFEQRLSFPINGSSIGVDMYYPGTEQAYKPYFDPFFMAMSNLTAGTPRPKWADESFFYLPFQHQALSESNTIQQAVTHAIGSSLSCVPLTHSGGSNYSYNYEHAQSISFNASILFPASKHQCFTTTTSQIIRDNPHGRAALEVFMFNSGHADDTTSSSNEACANILIAGWIRTTDASVMHNTKDGLSEEMWLACKPTMTVTSRKATVDLSGILLNSVPVNDTSDSIASMFQPSSTALVASVHRVLGQFDAHIRPTWHNDTYPSDFLNYLMTKTRNSSDFLNPALPPPSFEEVAPALSAINASLFAIILATNLEDILQPVQHTVQGFSISPESRLFVSRSMYIVSTTILGLYIVSTILVYTRRPWRILPRLPTNLANQVAYFAASHAVDELSGTALMTETNRVAHIESMGNKYGYGRFLGIDSGRLHVGIEREPLVQRLRRSDLREEQALFQ
ncbi:hypothetical protein AAFC00_003210 [Neodothiora populina]|uniref:Uncharacterized protein n=1 Tax=Neodothiora populina TaxID=2781224 RepID=A0ABR3P9N9_9PEZI